MTVPLERGAQRRAEEETRGRRRGDPARGRARGSDLDVPAGEAAREADHARRPTELLDPSGDVQLLGAQPIRREEAVGFCIGVRAEPFHELPQLGVAKRARVAIGEVLGGPRIDRFFTALGEIAIEQTLFLNVMRAVNHGLAPSRPRSLRAARKRWTRTVDSLTPMMALTSRGVQSP